MTKLDYVIMKNWIIVFHNLGTRVLSEPHTLLDSLYLYNNNILDDESYSNLVMNIIKIHVAQANHDHDMDTVVIKPMFKCTPQIKIIKER